MRHEIVTLAAAASWRTPVVLWQGLRARRVVIRLPQAAGDHGVIAEPASGRRTRVVVLGDSLAGGVGVTHHETTLAGGVATRIARRTGGPVAWQVLARTGYTAREAISLIDADVLGAADVVVVSVGANDTKNMHSAARWRTDLTALLDEVSAAAPSARVVLLPVPILQMCPALPPALARVLGSRAAHFDAIADDVSAAYPAVYRFDRFVPPGDDLFAADGFHPSATFHAIYADQIESALFAHRP